MLAAPTRWRRTPMSAATSSTARCGRAPRRRSTSCSTSCSSCPASPRWSMPATTTPRDSWRIAEHSNVTADGPPVYHFKTVIPIAGALLHAAGRRRDRALRRLPARPASGRAGSRTSPRSTSSRSSSRTASMSTRNRARSRSSTRSEIDESARQRGMGGDLQTMSDPALGLLMLALIVVVIMMGFPTAFTLMGLGMFFGFIAFYDPAQAWTRQPRLRPDGPAHLRRDDQRRPDLDPAVRADGLRDGARRAGRQDVLFDPARVPPRAGLARGRDADRLHVLGHRLAAWSAPSWC